MGLDFCTAASAILGSTLCKSWAMRFGVLRVLNDDLVQAGTGFDLHPHWDMEITEEVLTFRTSENSHFLFIEMVKPEA
jgi:redox-sensitive bicupin YhaK (pirin superfamily)